MKRLVLKSKQTGLKWEWPWFITSYWFLRWIWYEHNASKRLGIKCGLSFITLRDSYMFVLKDSRGMSSFRRDPVPHGPVETTLTDANSKRIIRIHRYLGRQSRKTQAPPGWGEGFL